MKELDATNTMKVLRYGFTTMFDKRVFTHDCRMLTDGAFYGLHMF